MNNRKLKAIGAAAGIVVLLVIIGVVANIASKNMNDKVETSDTVASDEVISSGDDETSSQEITIDDNGDVVFPTDNNGDIVIPTDSDGVVILPTDSDGETIAIELPEGPFATDEDGVLVTPTPTVTPSPTPSPAPRISPAFTPTPEGVPPDYSDYAGSYYSTYNVTTLYRRACQRDGIEPDPNVNVTVSFGMSLSEDGYFSVWGNTSDAVDTLEPLIGSTVSDAAASANASGTYTISGSSITFYSNDGRVVGGTITGSTVSFTTPAPYSIGLTLSR